MRSPAHSTCASERCLQGLLVLSRDDVAAGQGDYLRVCPRRVEIRVFTLRLKFLGLLLFFEVKCHHLLFHVTRCTSHATRHTSQSAKQSTKRRALSAKQKTTKRKGDKRRWLQQPLMVGERESCGGEKAKQSGGQGAPAQTQRRQTPRPDLRRRRRRPSKSGGWLAGALPEHT